MTSVVVVAAFASVAASPASASASEVAQSGADCKRPFSQELNFNCGAGTILSMAMFVNARYETTTSRYFVRVNDLTWRTQTGPWGSWLQSTGETIDATWTNGSGPTNSTVKFVNEKIGYDEKTSLPITLDGTFTATTTSNTLLTLSH